MKKIVKIDKMVFAFTNVLCTIAGLMMALLTGFVFAEVLCRYVFKKPIVITSEMTNLLFPWIVSLSAITIAKNNGNTALVFIKEKFKGKVRHILEIVIHIIMLYFSVMMTIASFSLSISLRHEILALTRISKIFTYGSMFIGFLGMTIVIAYNLARYIYVDIYNKSGDEK